jgi:isopentenyl diphosphate isomerase/L-lactate dehydrogenase-like FMN-dependent dehydrogenase
MSLARRRFLGWLAAGLSADAGLLAAACRDRSSAQPPAPIAHDAAQPLAIEDMLDVFDLRDAAQPKIPPAHWGNLQGGSDDGRTVRRNSEMFEQIQIRARRLVDISKTDTSITLLGTKLASPLVLCPLSGQEAYHPDGEVATATASSKRGHLMAMSSLSSKPVADIARAVGDPKHLWFQCYPTDQLSVTKAVIQRAEAAGAAAIILTADVPYRGNRTQMIRDSRTDKRPCESCHAVHPTKSGKRDWKLFLRQFPTYADLGLDDVKAFFRPITMDFVKELRIATKLPIVIKGIMTAGTRSSASTTRSTRSGSRTTAAARRTAAWPRSRHSPRSRPRSAASSRSSSTAASAAAPTSSRPSPSARPPSASAARRPGASARSAQQASSARSTSSTPSSSPR